MAGRSRKTPGGTGNAESEVIGLSTSSMRDGEIGVNGVTCDSADRRPVFKIVGESRDIPESGMEVVSER
jgi:hypothetical protein